MPRKRDARVASALGRRVAGELAPTGWELKRVFSDRLGEFAANRWSPRSWRTSTLGAPGSAPVGRHSSGFVERVRCTLLGEC